MNKAENRRTSTASAGFSLVEMAVIVGICSALLVAALGLIGTWKTQNALATNQQRLNAIQQALVNYEGQNNRLPCPSSFIAKTSAAYFGREISASCVGPNNPNGKDTYAATGRGGAAVIIGAVPVRDLGLPDSYRTDAYGYMFTYAITKSEATAPLNGFAGAIDVVDNTGVTVLSAAGTATYVVVDHGKDGKGAFAANSTAAILGKFPPGIPCGTNAGGLDAFNCNYAGVANIQFRSAPFDQATGASHFDDSIVCNTKCNKAHPSTNAQTCTTEYSTSAPGTSAGYHMSGWDTGGGWGVNVCFLIFCGGGGMYSDTLIFGTDPQASFPGTSSTAVAACPNAKYNVVAGGCTQTFGAPATATGPVTATAGLNGNTYNSPITNVYGADLNPFGGSSEQYVMPPLSHPAMPTAAGIQGWECNGSSSNGMQTQAYATCCTGGQ